VILVLSEKEFGDLAANKVSAQSLFLAGKLRIKGDIVKATKIKPVPKSAESKSRL
jgi:putative sterol carrier protein